MALVNSSKKVEVITSLSVATTNYMEEMHVNMKALDGARETIKLQVIDKIYNGTAEAVNSFSDFSKSISENLVGMAKTYGSREGMAPAAVEAFDVAKAKAAGIEGYIVMEPTCELSSDLDEDFTEDTVSGFIGALRNVFACKDTYISKVASIVNANSDRDTEELFQIIGGGIEAVTNGMATAFNANRKNIVALQGALEDIQASAKAIASDMQGTGASTARRIESAEADLA